MDGPIAVIDCVWSMPSCATSMGAPDLGLSCVMELQATGQADLIAPCLRLQQPPIEPPFSPVLRLFGPIVRAHSGRW